MKTIWNYIKRNAPVFLLGLVVVVMFLVIIIISQRQKTQNPGDFTRVEEELTPERESTQPAQESPTQYAPQIADPKYIGLPYFYGEYDPFSRDKNGYPVSPNPGSTRLSSTASDEDVSVIRNMELEKYKERIKPTKIYFTESGFSPADTSGFTGQEIIWTNKSTKEIKIVETVPMHNALKDGVVIKPGESFSFRPLMNKMLSYVEENTKKYGTVMVADVTQPLLPEYNQE